MTTWRPLTTLGSVRLAEDAVGRLLASGLLQDAIEQTKRDLEALHVLARVIRDVKTAENRGRRG